MIGIIIIIIATNSGVIGARAAERSALREEKRKVRVAVTLPYLQPAASGALSGTRRAPWTDRWKPLVSSVQERGEPTW